MLNNYTFVPQYAHKKVILAELYLVYAYLF